jgi:hypothetical protein
MSENAKTITFLVVGLVAIALGLATAPSSAELDKNTLVGKNLTEKFSTPEIARRLRVVRFDEDTAKPREFEVAEQNGLWSIPSKDNYPADAAKQMAEAATSLIDRKILGVVSDSSGDHEQYGVIDPMTPKLEPGTKGVGTRVTMSDEGGKPIVDLIVGKAVRDADKQRYVRLAGQDVVYVIEIDPSKLSTNFEDWIEKDLLKLHSYDLQEVKIKDYSAELVPVMTQEGPRFRPTWDPHSEMTLKYADAPEAKWSAEAIRVFDPKKGDYVDYKLAPDEELNDESLNALKSALEDLKIVDVVHKPQGLSNDLKAGADFMKNDQRLRQLASKGFTPAVTKEGGPLELVSSDGEVTATMKNGTKYVLRFGNLTTVEGGQEKDEKAPAAKDAKPDAKDAKDAKNAKTEKGDKGDKGVHRYLFVMTEFDENSVKKPELKKLPDLPAGKTDAKPADAAKADKPKEGANAKAGEKPADAKKADADAKKDEAKKAEEAVKKDEKKDDAAKKSEAAKKDGAKKDDAKKDGPAADAEAEKIAAERKMIEAENQKKLDDYQAQLKKGRENVKDLNLRFGDWYFVVNDDVFRKIRLSKDKVVKKKEKKADAAAAPGAPGAAPAGIPGLPQIPGASK